MTTASATAYALVLHLREADSRILCGMALIVASERYVAVCSNASDRIDEPTLTADQWREVDAWTAESNAALPAKPAPLSASIVSALVGDQSQPVTGERIAAVPIGSTTRPEARVWAERLLRGREAV